MANLSCGTCFTTLEAEGKELSFHTCKKLCAPNHYPSGLYGALSKVNAGIAEAVSAADAHLVGLGLTMEAISTNPIAYELLTDLVHIFPS